MNGRLTRAAAWLVRRWTWLYTRGLPPLERDERRAEIESDLWELMHDFAPTARWTALHLLVRLGAGVVDDLRWRREVQEARMTKTRVLTTMAIAAVAVAALFLADTKVDLPTPPAAASLDLPSPPFRVPPPPPPPPPPPRDGVVRSAGAGVPPPPPPPPASRR